MKRTDKLKATVLGVVMLGLTVVSAGAASADTATMPGDTVGTASTGSTLIVATDYGRGTTRSDNSPGNAGGLS